MEWFLNNRVSSLLQVSFGSLTAVELVAILTWGAKSQGQKRGVVYGDGQHLKVTISSKCN